MHKKNKNLFRIAAALVVFLFLISSVAEAVIKTSIDLDEKNETLLMTSNSEYYKWEDDFFNAQKIDNSLSDKYYLDPNQGTVEIVDTYPQWKDPDWTRMKIIEVTSQETINDCIIKLTIDYDTDMRSDYGDLRFKFNDEDYWLSYWIEEKNPDPNNLYAIVWLKIPLFPSGENEIYLFYGNPSAGDQSSYWSVFNENSWQKEYAHDHKVTLHMAKEGAWTPDVDFGEDRYLVSWMEGTPRYVPLGLIYQIQIRGCFYDEEGQRIGNRFDITPWDSNNFETFRCEDPSVAYGRDGNNYNFFVAYEYFETPNDRLTTQIHGAIVPRSTTGIGDITRFTICDASGIQSDPRVAFDSKNKRFFVVWEDGREGTGNYNIYGQLYDIDGTPVGSEKVISSRPHSQCQPWIAFDDVNNHFYVVWEEGLNAANGPFDIWGQLFDTNGNPLGSPRLISDQGTTNTDYNYPSTTFSATAEKFIVVWQNDDISSGSTYGNIWATIIDQNGGTAVSAFKVAEGNFKRAKVVPYLSSSFFISYDGSGEIWGSLVSSEGEILVYEKQLSDTESSPADWCTLGSDGEKLFVAWEDLRIEYMNPYDDLDFPDIYANQWSFKTPGSSNVNIIYGEEKSLVLNAYITSDPIDPENWENWVDFSAVVTTGSIRFDILDANNPNTILKSDISSDAPIQDITTKQIRLKATFNRDNPSTTPVLDYWKVRFIGTDDDPPSTSIGDIIGTEGLYEWYTSESVTVKLNAEDNPPLTGSGIDKTYYTINGGSNQVYNDVSGIILEVTQYDDWQGQWSINFWSVDNKGNVEDKTENSNTIEIKIDADKPYLEITSPADEAQVEAPFWVYATASDNVGVVRVEFDIEPFGEIDGLPYIDDTPPYEWFCDVQQEIAGLYTKGDILKDSTVSKMIQATAYDESGQSWRMDTWVVITNWEDDDDETPTLLILLLQKLIDLFPVLEPILQPLIALLSG